MNKHIDGKQCTILWHVNDFKISHTDANIVTEIINKLKVEVGKYGKLTVPRGNMHNYPGIPIDYSKKGKV